MSNDRYAVDVDAGNVDMMGYWLMKLKWREIREYMLKISFKV